MMNRVMLVGRLTKTLIYVTLQLVWLLRLLH